MSYVYFVRNTVTNNIKVGYSEHPTNRLAALQTANDCELKIIGCVKGSITYEKELHETFKNAHIRGEWFRSDILDEVDKLLVENGVNYLQEFLTADELYSYYMECLSGVEVQVVTIRPPIGGAPQWGFIPKEKLNVDLSSLSPNDATYFLWNYRLDGPQLDTASCLARAASSDEFAAIWLASAYRLVDGGYTNYSWRHDIPKDSKHRIKQFEGLNKCARKYFLNRDGSVYWIWANAARHTYLGDCQSTNLYSDTVIAEWVRAVAGDLREKANKFAIWRYAYEHGDPISFEKPLLFGNQ